jgi:hypothetical protein
VKCGARGSSGSVAAEVVAGAAPHKSANAIAPSPTPHCCKNHLLATDVDEAMGPLSPVFTNVVTITPS